MSSRTSTRKRPAPPDPVDDPHQSIKRAKESTTSSHQAITPAEEAASPSHQPTALPKEPTSSDVVIDAESFPHIMDAIFRHAPYKSLLALRGASKKYRDMVDRRLAEHVVLFGKVPVSAAGRMPAFSWKGVRCMEAAKALLPCARILDIYPVRGSPRHLWACRWVTHVQVLRLHTDEVFLLQVALATTNMRANTVVYTRAALTGTSVELSPLASASKVVLNVPWPSPDMRITCPISFFAAAEEFVFHFARPLSVTPFDLTRWKGVATVLTAYAIQFRCRERKKRGQNILGKKKQLALICLTYGDDINQPSRQPTAKPTGTHSMLNYVLSNVFKEPSFTQEEAKEIVGSIKFLSPQGYKAMVSPDQYILETASKARDCF